MREWTRDLGFVFAGVADKGKVRRLPVSGPIDRLKKSIDADVWLPSISVPGSSGNEADLSGAPEC